MAGLKILTWSVTLIKVHLSSETLTLNAPYRLWYEMILSTLGKLIKGTKKQLFENHMGEKANRVIESEMSYLKEAQRLVRKREAQKVLETFKRSFLNLQNRDRLSH